MKSGVEFSTRQILCQKFKLKEKEYEKKKQACPNRFPLVEKIQEFGAQLLQQKLSRVVAQGRRDSSQTSIFRINK
jgi:hypothetical protein